MKIARLPLSAVEDLWSGKINKTTRNEIRKALKTPGLVVQWGGAEEIVRFKFYPLYLAAMKRFGTPPHSVHYFLELAKKPEARKVWGEYKSQPIAFIFGWKEGNDLVVGYAPSDPKFWWTKIVNLLYWEFIQRAVKEKCDYVQFGTARYEGQIYFKQKWGCELYEDGKKRIDPDRWYYRIFRFLW